MRLGRLVAGGLIAGALAGFVAGLLRPRPRGVLPGLAPTADPSIAASAPPVEDPAPVTVEPDAATDDEQATGQGGAGTEAPKPDAPQPDAPQPDDPGWVTGEDGGEFAVSAGRSRPQGEGAG